MRVGGFVFTFSGDSGLVRALGLGALRLSKMPEFSDVRALVGRSLASQPARLDRSSPTPSPLESLTRASYPFTGICTSITLVP